ncbi:MAG: 4Fe-4S ferredoxin [Deltaproteobacteria bacterium]|nr:4Fe-4S ferredoxin [Deltaproteobacteria bacterium]
MTLKLDKKDFHSFLQNLMNDYELFAPVQVAEGVAVYKKIEHPLEAARFSLNPQKPAKEVFFPQSETMFRYGKVGVKTEVTSTEKVERKRILLGARPCDLQAVSLLDEIFQGREYSDPYYINKRQATTVIGMGCSQPLSTCFCSSMEGGPFSRNHSDIFLIDLGEAYLVEVLTEKGKAFEKNPFFKKATQKDLKAAKSIEKNASNQVGAILSLEGIERKLDQMIESPFWDRVQERCIGCRVCTYLCPTCHCFDIADETLTTKGQRVRNWDSCLSSLYSQETSGHNPRPTNRERTRQRLMHKFNYFPKNVGRIACVGCGRCVLYCPADLDIRETIKEIQKG